MPLPDFHPLLTAIEDCSKPVVMALHGTALGGGVEVAMAGHYRIAVTECAIGSALKRISGSSQALKAPSDLPRLVGVEKAIELVVSGKPIDASEALRAGLIDRVVEGTADGDHHNALKKSAVAFAREAAGLGAPPRTRERHDKIGNQESSAGFLSAGRELARKTRRNQSAPIAAIDAIAAAVSLPFEEGCERERELSVRCVRSEQCKALIHTFFAERACPVSSAHAAGRPVARVAIVGAGTMGGGIAMACANAGLDVILTDVAQPALDRGLASIGRNYETSVKRGRLTADAMSERLGRIHGHVGYDGVETADLVIEAVFESLALKQQVFADLDAIAKPDAVHGDQHLDARYRRHRVGDSSSRLGHRPAFLQSRQRHATRRNRAWVGDQSAGHRDRAGACQAAGEGRSRGRQRSWLRREPDDVPVHVRGAVSRRGRRDARTGRSGAHRLGHGDGHLCRRRHGRAGCGVARAPGARAVRGSRR